MFEAVFEGATAVVVADPPLTAEEAAGSEWVSGDRWADFFPTAPDEFVEVLRGLPYDKWTLAHLDEVDDGELSDTGLAHKLAILDGYSCYVDSLKAKVVADLVGPAPQTFAEHRDDLGAAEVSLATGVGMPIAQRRVSVDRDLHERLAAARVALAAGRITYAQVSALSVATRDLDVELAQAIEARVLRYSWRQDLTKFRKSLDRACAALDPDWTEKAIRSRREAVVEHTAFGDGTGQLYIRGPLEITTAVDRALSAEAQRTREELGGTAALRKLAGLRDMVDRFLDAPGAPRLHGRLPEVHITVDLPTVLGMRENPAQIVGVGPVPGDVARNLLADGAPLRRLIIDPDNGQLLDYGTRTDRVPTRLADFLIARYPTSATPFSNVDSRRCDMEHNVPAARGGPTNPINNIPTDRRWHRAKTFAGYSYRIDPATGIVTWRSPSGLTAVIEPYDYRAGP
jgi:Domain of unknown function (DUF222)